MEQVPAQSHAGGERRARIIRAFLAIVVLTMTGGMLYLFPRVDEFNCCFIPVVAALVAWFVGYEGRRKHLDVSSFVVPIFAMIALFIACAVDDGIRQVKEAEPRVHIMNQLKQISLALHAYCDKHGSFPPATVRGPDGAPLYSWRVLILPFLEQEDLYADFRLNEAWDSQHNRTLLARVPPSYSPATYTIAADRSMTFYQVFVGSGAAFESDKGLRLADFPDGPAETILLVEGREAVPWTKPVDLTYAQNQPLAALGAPRRHRMGRLQYGAYLPTVFCAAMADGSLRTFSVELPLPSLRGWITRNRGEKSTDQ